MGDNLGECLLAFYKGPKYNLIPALTVCLSRQPAIDTGGVKRQVFFQVSERIAFSEYLELFDGPLGRRRPAFRISSLADGVMGLVGRMIGHSVVLDNIGFPYLSPVSYFTMVGITNQTLLRCTPRDASERVQQIVTQVSRINYICLCG